MSLSENELNRVILSKVFPQHNLPDWIYNTRIEADDCITIKLCKVKEGIKDLSSVLQLIDEKRGGFYTSLCIDGGYYILVVFPNYFEPLGKPCAEAIQEYLSESTHIEINVEKDLSMSKEGLIKLVDYFNLSDNAKAIIDSMIESSSSKAGTGYPMGIRYCSEKDSLVFRLLCVDC